MNDYALVKDNPPLRLAGIDDLMEKVKAQGQSQYLTFGQVNADDYHSIYKYRDERGRKFLLTYFSPIETLIVKIPSCPSEPLHRNSEAWNKALRPNIIPTGRILLSRPMRVSLFRVSKQMPSGG